MSQRTVTLDVREEIRAGGAPCSSIMEAARQLADGDSLVVLAPFEPKPLYDVLGRQGFDHQARPLEDGDWEVRFTRHAVPTAAPAPTPEPVGAVCDSAPGEVRELDARGLQPPEPMIRILEAIETLPRGVTLRALTDRLPVHLFDQLTERGFSGTSEENPQGGHVTVIRRR